MKPLPRSFLLIFFLSFCASAQDNAINFQHFNDNNSFIQSPISSLIQSKKGFIWLGTMNGLMRFDGYEFIKYSRSKNVEGSISNNHINTVFEDSRENLWIGTENGVNFFNRNTNSFVPIDIRVIKGGRNYISSFIEDPSSNIWVGTFGGLKLLDQENQLLLDLPETANTESLNNSRILSLFLDSDNKLWVGTAGGLKIFNPITKKLEVLPKVIQSNSSLLSAKVWKVAKDSDGNLWFGTETKGVFKFNKKDNSIKQFQHQSNDESSLASNWINDILQVDENTLWFATNDGLSILKKGSEKFTNHIHNPINTSSISDNAIKTLMKDSNGSVWAGTVAGGINFFNSANSNFRNIGETVQPNFGLNNSVVNAICQNSDGSLWLGTYGGGLNYLNLNTRKSEFFSIEAGNSNRKNNIVTALSSNREGQLWCGTINGLYLFDKSKKSFNQINLSENPEDVPRPVSSLVADSIGVWVGTDGDGLKFVHKSGIIESYKSSDSGNSLSDNFITDLEKGKNGMWIATQNGLNFFDRNLKVVTKRYHQEEIFTLTNNNLTTLYTDSQKNLWIGTDYSGLNMFDEKSGKFFVIDKSLGLTNEAIRSILEDELKNLWVTTDEGLYRIKFLKRQLPFKSEDLEITSYSNKDGLAVKQFSNGASLKMNSGQLVFGGLNGLAIFDPKNIIEAPFQSRIYLTKLKIDNEEVNLKDPNSLLQKPLSETSEITLNHDQGYLGIEFSALNFINTRNINYAYKLDKGNFKDTWHELGPQHSVNFTGLQPGTHLFSVKTSNDVDDANVQSLKIIILPPWWRTNTAYAIYLLIAAFILWLAIRIVKIRIQLKKEIYKEHIENERQQEMYQMKLDFFTNISHEIRTPLTLINGPLEDLINTAEQESPSQNKLLVIKHNSDRLLKLINELMGFRKAEKGQLKIYCAKQNIVPFCRDIFESFKGIAVEKNIEYTFQCEQEDIYLFYDQNQLEKVIYNLLSNAFKFTEKNGKITFVIEEAKKRKWINIEIKDNGIGIPFKNQDEIFQNFFQVDDPRIQNMGSGVGLALSKKIVELHKGEIEVKCGNEESRNTTFTIALQKGKKHLAKNQILKSKMLEDNFARDFSKSLTDGPQNFKPLPNKKPKEHQDLLYIVDDNDEIREFLIDILQDDYAIQEFSNAFEALEAMETKNPDLIISDIMMPDMDGLEFCQKVKTNPGTNHIPVVLLTAKASVLNQVEGLSTGADAYISKPFSIKVLKLNIINLLSAQEIMQEKFSGRFVLDSHISKLTTPEEKFIKILMQIIESNMENPDFDVNVLVKEIGISRTVLYKKVQSLTNQSVASLIKQIRLKKAAEIFESTSFPVSDVAYMVGFNNRKHFSREFRAAYTMSPSEYKKKYTSEAQKDLSSNEV